MAKKEKESGDGLIIFDEFLSIVNVADIWKAQFMRPEDRHIVYTEYKKGADAHQQEEEFQTAGFFVSAFANMFGAKQIETVDGRETSEEGYIFDGILWTRPKVFTPDLYDVGGRILCYRKQVNSLSALIRGDAVTEEQLERRIVKIRESYIQQRKDFRESKRGSFESGMDTGFGLAMIRD